jgi:cytochrome o ubiquinol oxidase subunit 2
MSGKQKLWLACLLALAASILAIWWLHDKNIPLLQPAGPIGVKEKKLIIIAVLLSLIVVIPVYVMLIGFSLKYREGNKQARYEPELDGSRIFESIWWGVPLAIITVLAIITWKGSSSLDPFKPLNSTKPTMTIQVVSLQWKWLFIYPKQGIASVNYVQFPINTPVKFEITSDAPMNSFWIPQLGGQIYAMSGMSTNLNLEASKLGSYQGASANISGEGFSDMHFTANASSETDFKDWVKMVQKSNNRLDHTAYSILAAPSKNLPIGYFGSAENGIYQNVINKYAEPIYFKPQEVER